MKMIIPKLLKLEHKELHGELVEAIKTPGPIGKAAEAVAKVLHEKALENMEKMKIGNLGIFGYHADVK